MNRKLPFLLLLTYGILFILCAIRPYDRTVWLIENIPIVIIVTLLASTFRLYRFSNTSYLLMACLVMLHTIGGHYTFERVPFDWITHFFGFQRNHYDRIAHFSVGFYAFPLAELLLNKKGVRSKWLLYSYPIFFIFTIASLYEIIEWLYAASANNSTGAAFLGSQGDLWDAQKDMLADGLGAFFAISLFAIVNRNKKR